MKRLRDFTTARVALGRAGNSIATPELLEFQLAHARARDAVHQAMDAFSLASEIRAKGMECEIAASAAPDRATYLRRPDLGRTLAAESRERIAQLAGDYDLVFVIADGLSALAVHSHAVNMLIAATLPGWLIAPVIVVQQGRVAIGDEIGQLLGARLAVMLIGERPGLSSPDSLGIYVTWNPHPGVTDAQRNCLSNIRSGGIAYEAAARNLIYLLTESRRRKLTGVMLKEAAGYGSTQIPAPSNEDASAKLTVKLD